MAIATQTTRTTRILRRSLLGTGALVVVTAGAFFLIARLAGRHFHFDLPGRLGVNVSQTANGFTYSQSAKGHTVFTIHASKLVEYKADQARMHDVQITLYGPEGSNRTDKISGADFLYDRKRGVATAQGGVEIEMASPTTPAPGTPPGAEKQPIHIRTSSMSFDQNTSEATTTAPVDFVLTRASGHAVGASYNSKTGVLRMFSQVELISQRDRGVATIRAASAEFLRDSHMAFLTNASSEYSTEKSSSDAATLHFRPDGSVEQLEAEGKVHVILADGSEIHSGRANVALDAASQPVKADMFDGVTYASLNAGAGQAGANEHASTAGQTMHGNAVEGTLDFAGKGELRHAQFRNAVSFVDQIQSAPGERYASSTREMKASKLDIDFSDVAGKSVAQTALAVGQPNGASQANVVIHDLSAANPGSAKVTTISGDRLFATLVDGHAIRQLDGQGRTKVVDADADGAVSTSTGDVLHAKFIVTPKGAPRPQGDQAIASAVQTGNVTMLQQPARPANDGAKPQAPMHATAHQAEFGGADSVLHLTGAPHVTDGTLDVTADLIDYHRDTGDASALGNVKSTYIQEKPDPQQPGQPAQQKAAGPTLGAQGPVHIVSNRAELEREQNLSIFYGTPQAPARMWQGQDSVTAPVLELSKPDSTLYAHGGAKDHGTVVHTTLVQAHKAGDASGGDAPVTRVQAETLHYFDKAASADKAAGAEKAAGAGLPDTAPGGQPWRRADFHGSVAAAGPNGIIHSDDAHVFLTPDQPNHPSELDHILATGHVVITQPGRRGVGERLVYTASDTRYVLTGTPSTPPRVTDAEKGTTTGTSLIFTSANDSVQVAGSGAATAAATKPGRAVTDTRTQH